MIIISSIINLFRLFFLLLFCLVFAFFSKNKAIYFFLKFAGPTFIKLGQLLANRPDLVGDDLANLLSDFQDRLPFFSIKKVRKIFFAQFGKNITDSFSSFGDIPVASASIAQVHRAKTLQGEDVAVKILRPNIDKIFRRDITTLKIITLFIGIFSSFTKEKFLTIANLLQDCSQKELDLKIEAAAASQIKEKLQNIEGFYIPQIYWPLSSNKILTLEWIDGIAFSDREAILNSGFDLKKVAQNLVISYFNQVYNHGIFHADMHAGNLFLMKNGDIAAIDFGIVATIDKKTRIAIAEILMAFLAKDYQKVASLHIDAGLVPKDVDIEDFSLALSVIGQQIVDKNVADVSMAQLLASLLKMTKKYQMKTKPELLLLQKTMMLVEGVGTFLDKNLNIWDLARPFVKEWAVKNIGFDAKIRDMVIDYWQFFKNLPDNFIVSAPEEIADLNSKVKNLALKEKRWQILCCFLLVVFSLTLAFK
jgi:ubiquinone biosynthesis protein